MSAAAKAKEFGAWFARADAECLRMSGVGIEDLPDGNSFDAFDGGMSPRSYAHDLLVEEGFPFDDAEPVPAGPAYKVNVPRPEEVPWMPSKREWAVAYSRFKVSGSFPRMY